MKTIFPKRVHCESCCAEVWRESRHGCRFSLSVSLFVWALHSNLLLRGRSFVLTVCLDVIKTRVQTYDLTNIQMDRQSRNTEAAPLLDEGPRRPSSWKIAKQAYRTEGFGVFFKGLGVCSVRAFIVNAVQWGVSEDIHLG